MSSKEQKKRFETALEELKTRWQVDMEKIQKDGKLKLIGSQYKHSLDYTPATMEESMMFMSDVVHKMNLRGLTTANKTINQMRHEIKEILEAENAMVQLIEQISHSETQTAAMIQIMRYIPCIMHCENHVEIKMLTMLLIEGLSNAQGNLLVCEEAGTSLKDREEAYVERVNKIINAKLLGSEGNEAQFGVPLVKKLVCKGSRLVQ